MSTILAPVETQQGEPHVAGLPLFRFSVDEYERLGELGIVFDERVELLDGWVVKMNPIGVPHAYVVEVLWRTIMKMLPAGWDVFAQRPIRLQTSEPQPDLVVCRGTIDDYRTRHPGGADIGLLIEVADTTVLLDRTVKLRLYAAAGIPEYWVVNLPERQVEVYRSPRTGDDEEPAGYADRTIVTVNEHLTLKLDDALLGEIAVGDILP